MNNWQNQLHHAILGLLAFLGMFNVTIHEINIAWLGVLYVVLCGIYANIMHSKIDGLSEVMREYILPTICLFLFTFLYSQNLRLWGIVWMIATLLWCRVGYVSQQQKNTNT